MEVNTLKQRLEALERSKAELLKSKNQEIRNLREKIRALEALDQKIQEKKKEVSAPQ
jgi:prefoldin subunit 5